MRSTAVDISDQEGASVGGRASEKLYLLKENLGVFEKKIVSVGFMDSVSVAYDVARGIYIWSIPKDFASVQSLCTGLDFTKRKLESKTAHFMPKNTV